MKKKSPKIIRKLWKMPKHLGPYGQEFFKKNGPEYIRLGLITVLNKADFENLSALQDVKNGCLKAINEGGTFQKDGGKLVKNPASTLLMQALAQIQKISLKFSPENSSPEASGDGKYQFLSMEDLL